MRIMHNYLQNAIFLYHNLKLYERIEMHSKYDNIHTNRIFNVLYCINNNVNSCINCILSVTIRAIMTKHDGQLRLVINIKSQT